MDGASIQRQENKKFFCINGISAIPIPYTQVWAAVGRTVSGNLGETICGYAANPRRNWRGGSFDGTCIGANTNCGASEKFD